MGSNPSIICVVQARLNSSRIEKKLLQKLKGMPVIEWVIARISQSRMLDEIVFTLPIRDKHGPLEKLINKERIPICFGEENNLVDRFIQCLPKRKPYILVRVCADNPLICPLAVDQLVNFYLSSKFDYAFNHVPKQLHYQNLYPDGLGAEICSRNVVNWIGKSAQTKPQKEHFFKSLFEINNSFKIGTFNPSPELQFPDVKLDVDTKLDLKFLEQLQISPCMSSIEVFRKNKTIIDHWSAN